MFVDFDVSRLRRDILRVFVSESLADKSRFGQWLGSALADEEVRRDRALTADEGRPVQLHLPDLDVVERSRFIREIADACIGFQAMEHKVRPYDADGADALLEVRRFISALGLALESNGPTTEQFLESAPAGAIN